MHIRIIMEVMFAEPVVVAERFMSFFLCALERA
jgi:hypothetical protein